MKKLFLLLLISLISFSISQTNESNGNATINLENNTVLNETVVNSNSTLTNSSISTDVNSTNNTELLNNNEVKHSNAEIGLNITINNNNTVIGQNETNNQLNTTLNESQTNNSTIQATEVTHNLNNTINFTEVNHNNSTGDKEKVENKIDSSYNETIANYIRNNNITSNETINVLNSTSNSDVQQINNKITSTNQSIILNNDTVSSDNGSAKIEDRKHEKLDSEIINTENKATTSHENENSRLTEEKKVTISEEIPEEYDNIEGQAEDEQKTEEQLQEEAEIKEWEEHISNFNPENLLTFDLNHGKKIKFYERLQRDANVYIAYYVHNEGQKVNMSIKSKNRKIHKYKNKSRGYSEINLGVGVYEFIFEHPTGSVYFLFRKKKPLELHLQLI